LAHILVVEDDDAICRLLSAALEEDGLRVTCAQCGSDALRHLEREEPQLAVIDVGLPDMSGLDVARAAMAAGVTPLVVSGHPEQCRRLEEAGCPCIAKPYRLAALLARVRALLFDGAGHVAACRAALERMAAAV
jgi:DNA-binding response OmpR family regulator